MCTAQRSVASGQCPSLVSSTSRITAALGAARARTRRASDTISSDFVKKLLVVETEKLYKDDAGL
jgi:hypothetical protein